MAWQIPQSTDAAVNLGTTDNVFVAKGVLLSHTDSGDTVVGTGSDHNVIVEGTIAGTGLGLGAYSTSSSGEIVDVRDSGVIFGAGSTALVIQAIDSQVINAGQIEASGPWNAIAFRVVSATPADAQSTILNSGVLKSDATAVFGDTNQKILLTNSGTIDGGDFSYSSGAESHTDSILNSGKMIGDIGLGEGDDIYDGRKGSVDGVVYGGGGGDKVYGGKEANTFDGGIGNDRLDGGDGDDVLIGGAGTDALIGGSGTDTASYSTATAGVNVYMTQMKSNTGDAAGDAFSSVENLTGSDYTDKLSGDATANGLNGGAGNDFLYGGAGADKMVGGLGADIFIYKATSESSVTSFDTVKDFSETQKDRFDLSGIDASTIAAGNNAFVFIGNAAFTGSADQLRFQSSASGTEIYGDTNGDKVADFRIHLSSAQTLHAGDFTL